MVHCSYSKYFGIVSGAGTKASQLVRLGRFTLSLYSDPKTSAGFPVHVIQRGNNRQAILTSDGDLASWAHRPPKIRHCANTGLALGTEAFQEQVQRLRS